MKTHPRLLALILIIALLAACAPAPTPTAMPTATFTPQPTSTPTPTVSPTQTLTPEPTATVEAVIIYPPMPEAKENWDGQLQLWLNPDYVFEGVEVTAEGPARAGLFLEEAMDANKGFPELVGREQVAEYLVKNNGIVPGLGIPVEDVYGLDGVASLVKFIKRGQIDLKKPVEIRMYSVGDPRIEKDLDKTTIIWLSDEGDNWNGLNYSLRDDGGLVVSMIEITEGITTREYDDERATANLMASVLAIFKYQNPKYLNENGRYSNKGALFYSFPDVNNRDYYQRANPWFKK